jgi:hypothetical protein
MICPSPAPSEAHPPTASESVVICPSPPPADLEPIGEGMKVFSFALLAAVVVIAVAALLVRNMRQP